MADMLNIDETLDMEVVKESAPVTHDVLSTQSGDDPRIYDVLLHIKDQANVGEAMDESFIAFPYTKFDNVLGRPVVTQSLQEVLGAPFVFLSTTETITESEYSAYFAHII